jgi:hypothetical protein
MSIQILKETVEAKTRRLSARWTFEAAQDAEAMHGVDVEAEIMQALAQEIVVEIDQEIINSLRALATPNSTEIDFMDFQYNNATLASGTDSAVYAPVYVGDRHAILATEINRSANRIAARTRRGAGNYVVVSPEALTILQSASTSTFARTTEGSFEAPTNTKFVGTLNGTIRVFVDNYANDGTMVLVGYTCVLLPIHPTDEHRSSYGSKHFRASRIIHDTLWLQRVDKHCFFTGQRWRLRRRHRSC